jgi:class 3 adenylate cyclase
VETFTFLFTDIEGSTVLLRRLGDARYARVLTEHHALIRPGCAPWPCATCTTVSISASAC